MDKVLKDFYEEKKRKHLEYLRLYKNNDEEVREIQKEIEKLEHPLSDLENLKDLIKNISSKYECKPFEYKYIGAIEQEVFGSSYYTENTDIDILIDILHIIYNIRKSENRFKLSENNFINLKEDIKRKNLEHPLKIRNQETEEEAYKFIIKIQEEYIKLFIKTIDKLCKNYKQLSFYEIYEDSITELCNVLTKVRFALKNYKPIVFNQIPQIRMKFGELEKKRSKYMYSNHITIQISKIENEIEKIIPIFILKEHCLIGNLQHFIYKMGREEFENYDNKWFDNLCTLKVYCDKLYDIFTLITHNYSSFISKKEEMKRNGIEPSDNINVKQETEEDAYNFIVCVQKEYIKSIMESINVVCEKYNHLSFFKPMNDTLTKIYDSLSNYVPIKFDQISQYWTKISELKEEINCNYEYIRVYGHWYSKYGPKRIIEISPQDYVELCKKYPPYLMEIEGFVQDTYKNGYDKGHKNGYDEGYSDGYDEGYRMG